MVTRGMLPADPGTVHWSIGSLVRSDTLATIVLEGPYAQQALVPASPWMDARAPAPPSVAAEWAGADLLVGWAHPDPDDVFCWVVYFRVGDAWSWRILPRQARQVTLALPPDTAATASDTTAAAGADRTGGAARIVEVAVSAVDRVGNESRPTSWRMPP